ncbi:MAG: methionine--tRNA ligase [Magnetococcales bacterium]|nr:methionine--tRNA ligase [Magnetococcales bacterium]
MRPILVTSALPYANGPIHLGHLVEYIQTDIWVRYHKLRGRSCLYMCADDTHGTPVMIRAQQEGISPDVLVARMHEEHLRDFTAFHIDFDNYYSTNTPENRGFAEEIYLKLRESGHIRVAEVMQAFCPKDGMFLPDRYIRGVCPSCGKEDQYGDSCEGCSATYAPTELKNPRCAICGTPPVEKGSEHYFFQLGHFEAFLKEWTHSGALQEEMANKLDEWFEQGLKDWDVSRDGPYFGFEIPDAPGKYFYVWLDAPIGYMASSRNYCDKNGLDFDRYWRREEETEVYHFIGKDILYFHTLFWPAMLKGGGFRTPTAVFVHGFLTVNGAKMSKSRGTFINARSYLEHLDPEYLRYYYAAKLTARVDDIDLNFEDFLSRVNSDLVGKLVNVAARTAGFLGKGFEGMLAEPYPEDGGLYQAFLAKGEEIGQLYQAREYARAMQAVMRLAEEANRYVEQNAPWVLAKDPGAGPRLQQVCSVAINLFRVLVTYLQPVLPALAQKVERFMNLPPLRWEDLQKPLQNHRLGTFSHLMVRVDPARIEALLASGRGQAPSPPPPVAVASKPEVAPLAATIDIEAFSAVDLRVARILTAESVEGADKLLRLRLDLGGLGERTVLAGIRAAYDPATLPGRLTVMVANLAPRTMRFGTSEGMVLAAGPGGKEIYLLQPDSGAVPGMRLK